MDPRAWLLIISVMSAILVARNESLLALILYRECVARGSWRGKVQVIQVNESLYKVQELSNSTSFELPEPRSTPIVELEEPQSMVILFFHGFYSNDPFSIRLSTWESEDGSCIWPVSWLVEAFPGASIMFVSYSASVEKNSQEKFDMEIVTENLAFDLLQEGIGQTPNCPIILVGHCIGGLVIKQLCLHIFDSMNLTRFRNEKTKGEIFLENIKGIFYYGTPHRGSPCIEKATSCEVNPLLKYYHSLSKEAEASRLDFKFSPLCKKYIDWQIHGLGEGRRTKQGPFQGDLPVAPEACARDGGQFNVIPAADHISITKPKSKTDRRYYALTGLLHTILNNLEGHLVQGLPKYLLNMEKPVQEIQEKLKHKAILGIFGMAGVGKTTLAKVVYNMISKEFEYTCFVEKVKQKEELEDWLLSHFHRHGRKMKSIHWRDLKQKKILIVMDDVESQDQLAVLPVNSFRSGSKIIITSRNKQVWTAYGDCNEHAVEFLEVYHATKLFCLYAFGHEELPDYPLQRNKLKENVRIVVDSCDGLPLTLEVMGSYLGNHKNNTVVWEETIVKLANAQTITGERDDRVWAQLRVSYDALGVEEKRMFIEAATIFFEQPVDQALAAWSTSICNAETTWFNLVSRSMVKEVSKSSFHVKKQVWVHEQLRNLATKLANSKIDSIPGPEAIKLVNLKDNEQVTAETTNFWLEERSSHVMHKSGTSSFSTQFPSAESSAEPLQSLVDEDTIVLRLDERHWTGTLHLDSLAKLRKLKYLELYGIKYEGSGRIFPTKLSLLKWVNHKEMASQLPISINNVKNLAVLTLENWDVQEGFSEQLGNLPNLCMLRLKSLRGLDTLPEDFSNPSRLKHLELEDLSLSSLPESIGNVDNLERLILISIRGLKSLPDSFGDLSSLVVLRIDSCKQLASLPVSFGRSLTSLKELSITNCPLLHCLPQSFYQLPGLQLLNISECRNLTELGHSFGNLPLRHLLLRSPNMKRLPASFDLLSNLVELKLEGADRFKILPESLGTLLRLKILRIQSDGIKYLPNSFSQLSALKDLRIEAARLKVLPESFGQLSALQDLKIEAASLVTLPSSIGQLASLKDLFIGGARLTSLPNSIGNLRLLETLYLRADRVKALPQSLWELSSLWDLKIHAKCLESIPTSVRKLSCLHNLQIDCENLKKLPDSLGELDSLEELSIRSVSLEKLPESMGQLKSLRALELVVKSMSSLPKSIGQLSSLRNFTFSCDGHERMPNLLDDLPSSLENLHITHMQSLESLPNLEQLSSLRRLAIGDSEMLESIPESLGRLPCLKEVSISNCNRLKSVPDSLGRPSSSQGPLPQGESNNELMNIVGEPFSLQPTATEVFRLYVKACRYLDATELRRLGWVEKGDSMSQYYVREETFPDPS